LSTNLLVPHQGDLYPGPRGYSGQVSVLPLLSAHKITQIQKILFESGVRRFTGGFQPQGNLPRLMSEGFGQVCSTIRDLRDIYLYVPFLHVSFWRLIWRRLFMIRTVRNSPKSRSPKSQGPWADQRKPPRLRDHGEVDSAELSRTLKVLDRGGDAPKPAYNQSDPVCAGLRTPLRTFLAWLRQVWGRAGPQIDELRLDSEKFPGPF
jgi:hypothetical protein